MKIFGYGKANIEDIERYEKTTGFIFPEDYKQFLLENNGGYPEYKENYIVIPNVTSEKIKLCFLAGVTGEGEVIRSDKNLFYITSQQFGALIDHSEFIPFARPYGYYGLLLGISEERAGVFLYDYQVRLKESSKKKVLHKICDTFTEFLELIRPVEN